MRKSSKPSDPISIMMKKGGCQWEVAFGRRGNRPPVDSAGRRGGISIQRHVADLQVKILSKETFKIGVAILRSLMRDRYSSASRFEQRQLYSTVSRVATLLTTQFTGEEFWTVGLSLFKAAKRVITEVDELMHIGACIDLSHKFLGDDRQRKEILAAVATVSGHSVDVSYCPADEPLQETSSADSPTPNPISEMEAEDRREEPEPDPVPEVEPGFPEEDPDMRLVRMLTMEELSMEIQAILHRVNRTFVGRSRALAAEFTGLQEAIQATLQEINNAPRGPPPAAKEEIEKLSIVAVTKSVLARIGEGTQCAVCREPLVEGDIMQEMPCIHSYHLNCLKPWLEKHNSCPICRFELRTEDEDYERRKQEDHKAKEQRRRVQIALTEEELRNI